MSKRLSTSHALAALAGAVLLAGPALPASAAASGPATARPATSRTLSVLTSVSCASTSHCWAGASDAGGAAIVVTTDGGTTWKVDYTATRFDDIAALDCTSATHCVAIGDTDEGTSASFLETTDGGVAWTVRAAPASLAIAETLSCANSSDCWAIGLATNRVDGAIDHTTDGGRMWSAQSIPKIVTAMSNPFGISCASATRCLATGDSSLTTVNGGRTWTAHPMPEGAPLGPVDCPSTTACYAIVDVTSAIPANEETSVYTSTDAGTTWKDALSDPKDVAGLGGLSCATTSTCVAAGGGYTPRPRGTDTLYAVSEATSTGGRTWTEKKLTVAQYLDADSCVRATDVCVAVGSRDGRTGVILRTTDDGASWTSESVPAA